MAGYGGGVKSEAGFGEFRTTQVSGGEGHQRLFIDRADPRVLVSAAAVEAARSGDSAWTSMDGEVLHVKATNRSVAYRLGDYVPERFGYVGEMVS